jgi:hypothetical protein
LSEIGRGNWSGTFEKCFLKRNAKYHKDDPGYPIPASSSHDQPLIEASLESIDSVYRRRQMSGDRRQFMLALRPQMAPLRSVAKDRFAESQ